MGIFNRSKAAEEPVTPTPAFERALSEIRPLDIEGEFPAATARDAETMEAMWIAVVSNVGGGQFDARQVAAISTLAERLVSANPALSGFVDRLREIAQRESERRPSEPSWPALVRHL